MAREQNVSFHAHAGEPVKIPLVYIRSIEQEIIGEVLVYPDGSFSGDIEDKKAAEAVLGSSNPGLLLYSWAPSI